jgi:glycosyltransferase involved in cell wall biosynthesis
MTQLESPALMIAVDLIPVRPGGANGGHKPAVLAMLAEATRQMGEGVAWVFLTNSSTHGEIRSLARKQDILICVEEFPGHPFAPKHSSSPSEFKLVPRPLDLIKSLEVDLLYCPFGATYLHAEGTPTLAFIADLLHLDYPRTLTPAQIAERKAYIGHTVKVAAMIQCNSRSGVERVISRFGIPEDKLFHTYLPIQLRLDRPSSDGTDFGRELGLKKPYFFYPANLWTHKNHETLLLAYRLYRENAGGEAWDLVLTFHKDESYPAFRELIEVLGISRHVHCPGYVEESSLQALWKNAGALVFPSLHEGFGIPLVEAMHYGVPIVSGTDFSLKEIGGDACLRVDSRKPESIADGLLEIASDSTLRECLISKGRQRLAFFDLRVETSKLVEVFRTLPKQKDGFPRKPKVLEDLRVLTVTTPASDQLWTVEISPNPSFPQNRYAVYLDGDSFGSFSSGQKINKTFHFKCRPLGRTLRIAVTLDSVRGKPNDATVLDGAIQWISASGQFGEQLTLYQCEQR